MSKHTFLILLMFAVVAPYAEADLASINPNLCNEGDTSIWFVGAYRQDGWLGDKWQVMGWMEVKPHECREIGDANINESPHGGNFKPAIYISVMYLDSDGKQRPAHFDSDPAKGWFRSDRPLCMIEPDAFKYETSDYDDGPDRRCGSGYTQISATFATGGYSKDPYSNPGGTTNPSLVTSADLHLRIDSDKSSGNNSPSSTTESKSKDTSDGIGILDLLRYAAKTSRQYHEKTFREAVENALSGPGATPMRRRECSAGVCQAVEVCAEHSLVQDLQWGEPENEAVLKAELGAYLQANVMEEPRGLIHLAIWLDGQALYAKEVNSCSDNQFSTIVPVKMAVGS